MTIAQTECSANLIFPNLVFFIGIGAHNYRIDLCHFTQENK